MAYRIELSVVVGNIVLVTLLACSGSGYGQTGYIVHGKVVDAATSQPLGQETVRYPLLKKTIDSLAFVDQKVQQDFIESFKSGQFEKFERIEKETFIRHTPILKEIVKKYGFPTYDLVGKQASNNYWLCVQHCDHDLPFQQAILAAMEPAVKAKQADPKNFAYLLDRVNINSGKPQVYGTQVTYKDRTAVPKDLANPAHVNQKRLAIGLDSLETYLRLMTTMHRQMSSN